MPLTSIQKFSSLALIVPLLCSVFIHIPPTVMGWRKFETVAMIPQSYFQDQETIYGFTERVIDGDTIRVRHIPAYTIRRWIPLQKRAMTQPLQQRGIAQETLSIRIYGVDCPEIAKTKSQQSQPYAEEAKQRTSEMCLHRIVRITLLRRDQYGRAVCAVETLGGMLPCGWMCGGGTKDISMELAKSGLAELYTGGGAEYWNRRERLETAIDYAVQRKLGIWSIKNRISAAEQKRLQKLQQQQQQSGYAAPVAAAGASPYRTKKTTTTTKTASNKENKPPSKRTTAPERNSPRRKTLLESAVTGLEILA